MKTAVMTKQSSNIFRKVAQKISFLVAWIVGAFLQMPMMVYADDPGTIGNTQVTINENVNAGQMFGKVAGLVLDVARYAGVILAIMGVVKLVVALNNDQADQIKGSVMMIFSGVIMVALKTILVTLGLVSSVS